MRDVVQNFHQIIEMKVKIILILLIISNICAYEKQNACVSYQTSNGWSKKYKIKGFVYDGLELNGAIGSISRFESFRKYFVIFWNNSEASFIKFQSYYLGGIIMFDYISVDENGHQWKIGSPDFCF